MALRAAARNTDWGPDRYKAKLYREATCPRRPWSVSIGGFGEDVGKDKVEKLLGLMLPLLVDDFLVQGGFKLDLDAEDLRFWCVCANPISAQRLAKRVQGFELDGEDPWAVRIQESLPQREWTQLRSTFEGATLSTRVVKKVMATINLDKAQAAAFEPGGPKEFAKYGLGVYLYFITIRHLRTMFITMSLFVVPVLFFNNWDNGMAKLGCPVSKAAPFDRASAASVASKTAPFIAVFLSSCAYDSALHCGSVDLSDLPHRLPGLDNGRQRPDQLDTQERQALQLLPQPRVQAHALLGLRHALHRLLPPLGHPPQPQAPVRDPAGGRRGGICRQRCSLGQESWHFVVCKQNIHKRRVHFQSLD